MPHIYVKFSDDEITEKGTKSVISAGINTESTLAENTSEILSAPGFDGKFCNLIKSFII